MSQNGSNRFLGRLFTVLGATGLLVGLVLLAWDIQKVLLMVAISILIATFWRVLSRPLLRVLPERVAVLTMLAFLIAVPGLLLWLIFPSVVAQAELFAQQLPEALAEIEEFLRRSQVGSTLLAGIPSLSEVVTTEQILSRAASAVPNVLTALIDLVSVFFLTLFFGLHPSVYLRGIVRLFPLDARSRADEVLVALGTTLQHWLLGRILGMVAVGLLVTLGVWLLGLPFPLFLGVVAFSLEFVPYVGPIAAALPAVVVGLAASPTLAIMVVALYFLVSQIEGNLITPLLMETTVHLPPALTIVSIYVFGQLFGFLGLIIATPSMALILKLIQEIYLADVLGEEA